MTYCQINPFNIKRKLVNLIEKPIIVNFKLLNTKQNGSIIKKDLNKIIKVSDVVSANNLVIKISTFKEDNKTIERHSIEGIIYFDKVIEVDDMKNRNKIDCGTTGIDNQEPTTLDKIYNLIDTLRIDMNSKFEKVDKRFEELEQKFDTKLNDLETRIEQKFDTKLNKLEIKIEQKFDNKLKTFKTEIFNHISNEFKKHIKEYH